MDQLSEIVTFIKENIDKSYIDVNLSRMTNEEKYITEDGFKEECKAIKQTLKDGSFYTIDGRWYVKDGQDLKSFSSDGTKELAMKAVNDLDFSNDNKAFWSALGTSAVFPIKITTRRNLYQYTFTFGRIGAFSNGSLGRIMGEDISVIKINDRSCFYEVYESICKCCGDPINTEAHLMSGVTTTDYINENEVDYIESNYTIESNHPELGFFGSVISLNDINADTGGATGDNPGRILGINWNDNEPYYVDGYKHSTSKGEELAKYIQNIGENVYSYTPEYSFKITPELMLDIRKYNDENGYEIELGKYRPYSPKTIIPANLEHCRDTNSNSCIWEPKEDSITFVHYGSKFLEGTIIDGVNWNLNGSKNDSIMLKNTNVCEITSEELNNGINNMVLYDMVTKKKCRWIDYIDEDIENNKSNSTYYRLAFK